mmetsp:Transcript_8959/g.11429  ORF Transcript_8959/g.11429 Transcript_8959/m.11429 type:complete len:227 (+) Transcript_8959:3080-3760(+)
MRVVSEVSIPCTPPLLMIPRPPKGLLWTHPIPTHVTTQKTRMTRELRVQWLGRKNWAGREKTLQNSRRRRASPCCRRFGGRAWSSKQLKWHSPRSSWPRLRFLPNVSVCLCILWRLLRNLEWPITFLRSDPATYPILLVWQSDKKATESTQSIYCYLSVSWVQGIVAEMRQQVSELSSVVSGQRDEIAQIVTLSLQADKSRLESLIGLVTERSSFKQANSATAERH